MTSLSDAVRLFLCRVVIEQSFPLELKVPNAGRFDLVRLKEAMMLLIANDTPLGLERLDHALTGACADYRECHIEGDFLLMYQVEVYAINFVQSGTHFKLFGS